MAVFLVNNCKFRGCGLIFSTLGELIHHIEDEHIDTDPRALERQELQQPTSLALSYVYRCNTETFKTCDVQKKKARAQSPASSLRSSTPTGSEFDEDDVVASDGEDSDDSWTTQDDLTENLIRSVINNKEAGDVDKPYPCPIPGCKKRYKNVNGIKYHAKHGHKKDTRVRKAFKCKCGKSYKTGQSLRAHTITSHPPEELMGVLQSAPATTKLQQQVTPASGSVTTSNGTVLQQVLTPVAVTQISGTMAVTTGQGLQGGQLQAQLLKPTKIKTGFGESELIHTTLTEQQAAQLKQQTDLIRQQLQQQLRQQQLANQLKQKQKLQQQAMQQQQVKLSKGQLTSGQVSQLTQSTIGNSTTTATPCIITSKGVTMAPKVIPSEVVK